MGPWLDLTAVPSHRWEPLYYFHESEYYQHYVNPWSGAFSHLSLDRAARLIQAMVRTRQLRPFLMTKEELKRVVPFVKRVRREYAAEAGMKKLMPVINLALVCHVVWGEEEEAKKLYIEAIGLSEANPLVTRAFGFFVLGTCEAPIGPNRERALKLLGDAKRRDETHHKFQMASLLFRFGNLCRPRDVRALCNRALVDSLLYSNNWNGERVMRRALSINAFELRVIETWNFLKDRFVDHQRDYQPVSRIQGVNTLKGGKRRMVHGRTATECPAWAGWVFIEDDELKISKIVGPYWYNPVTAQEQTKAPDWHKEWHTRLARAQFQKEEHGLDFYYDPLTAVYFQHHKLTDSFQ